MRDRKPWRNIYIATAVAGGSQSLGYGRTKVEAQVKGVASGRSFVVRRERVQPEVFDALVARGKL